MVTEASGAAPVPSPARSACLRRLVINADDFGRDSRVNAAVAQAHAEGILTSASLMVNEPGSEEAVALARSCPRLGVGLHLTLARGHAALSRAEIPSLLNPTDDLPNSPVLAGLRYFLRPSLRDQLRREIRGQFAKFAATGLRLDHVNAHLHLHLHPVILRLLLEEARSLGIRHMRLTADPLGVNLSLARGRLPYRLSHALVFGLLSWRARPRLAALGIRSTERVFGLLQDGDVNADFLCALLRRLPIGASELYCHPSTEAPQTELRALIDPEVVRWVRTLGIELIRYQDL